MTEFFINTNGTFDLPPRASVLFRGDFYTQTNSRKIKIQFLVEIFYNGCHNEANTTKKPYTS